MSNRFTALILFFSLLFIISCNKSGETPTGGSTEPVIELTGPFPLHVGNSWTYRVSSFDAKGNNLGNSGSFTYQIDHDTTVSGERLYYFGSNGVGLYYLNRSTGVWNYNKGTFLPLLKYPSSKNTWYTSTGGNMRVVSVDSTIVVPKGRYSCYQYRLSQSTPAFDYYFASGVGLVRIDFFDVADSVGTYVATRYELADYTLN